MATDETERTAIKRRLRHLSRINDVIIDVNHAIISAETRADLETAVCAKFAASEPYVFAWIGSVDTAAGRVTPRAVGGAEEGYLDDIEITLDDTATGQGPTGRAIATGDPQAMQDILENPEFSPWRERARERGYRSSAAFPLESDGTLYGVLNLYADRVNAFNPDEMAVLELLANDIAFAIHAHVDREALELSEERLSLAGAAANVGVWDWQLDDDRLVWDAQMERLFGLEPGSFEGTYAGFANRVHPEDLPAVEAAIEDALASGDQFEAEFRIVPDAGTERWLLGLGTTIADEGGQPVRLVGVNVDVTERKEREQHIRVLDRVLRHNLRNAVNVIEGSAENIQAEATGTVAESAGVIISRSLKLLETADKERKIVEILTGQSKPVTLDVVAVVREAIETMRERYPTATIEYDGLQAVSCTISPRLGLAVEELVENAVVHNDTEAPRVRVTVRSTADTVEIRVEDNGPQIPEMDVGVLTGEEDIGPLYHGTGLGFWLVHWIVRQADGTLAFDEAEPRGNVVTIRLPTE